LREGSVTAGAGVSVGEQVGIGGGGEATYVDGVATIGVSGEVAVLLGVEVDLSVSIDTNQIAEDAAAAQKLAEEQAAEAKRLADEADRVLAEQAKAAQEEFDRQAREAAEAAAAAQRETERLAREAQEEFDRQARAAQEAADAAARETERLAREADNAFKDAGNQIDKGFKKAFKW
jgi:flagellar biosynthesis GTPase FlhF